MAKMLDSEEVFKGHFVIIYRNQLNGFLSKYFAGDLCNKIHLVKLKDEIDDEIRKYNKKQKEKQYNMA